MELRWCCTVSETIVPFSITAVSVFHIFLDFRARVSTNVFMFQGQLQISIVDYGLCFISVTTNSIHRITVTVVTIV